jgi:hypothetical protein
LTATADIERALAHVLQASLIDFAILRVRLGDDPEALRTVDAFERRMKGLTKAARCGAEMGREILDAIARYEEQR